MSYNLILILPRSESWYSWLRKWLWQVQNVSAKHVMKCDDDTFVRVDRVLQEVSRVSTGRGLYMGNMNEYHVPLRTGKWAVTFEVLCITSSLFCVIRCTVPNCTE
jgi:hypothetical protein